MTLPKATAVHVGLILVLSAAVITGCNGQGGSTTTDAFVVRNASPTAPDSLAPHLAMTRDGKPVLSWLEPSGDDGHAVRFSVLRGDAWSSPVSVAQGNNWFVNYADVPSVVPITADLWSAHWLTKKPGSTYAYDIALSISSDGGATWTEPMTPHHDGTPTEHGFVTLFPWSDAIGIVWLDGRNTSPDATSSASPVWGKGESPPESPDTGGMTLRYARLDYAGKELDGGEIDNRVCDCCQTDVALTGEGPIIAYRDRSENEIRDISVARFVGSRWSEPATISDDHWQIAACPVNGPAVAADGDHVVVAWYAAPEGKSRVKVAWSRDSGQTFSAPLFVDDGGVSGRVDVAMIDAGKAAIIWVGKNEDGIAQVRMREIGIDGDTGPVRIVAEGEFSRGTGFPQMLKSGSRLVFAWPEAGEKRRILTGLAGPVE